MQNMLLCICFFIAILQQGYAQLSYEVFTDKESYEYGEKIVLIGRVYNHSDSTVNIISNTSGFILPLFFNDALLQRFALPLEVEYKVPAKSYYSIRFVIDPQQMGLPNKDGLNQIVSRVSWFYQPFSNGFSAWDTVEFNAPAFLGGELFVTYSMDSLNIIHAIKDNMNATVLHSDTSYSSEIITEQWQTSGYILDSLLYWYSDTAGILEIYANRDLWADSFFVTALDEPQKNPAAYQLYQNYPNPFNPVTRIKYAVGATLDLPADVELTIYNLLGQKIADLVNKKQPAGIYEVQWDASGMPSGIYFYTLQTDNFFKTKKMILLR